MKVIVQLPMAGILPMPKVKPMPPLMMLLNVPQVVLGAGLVWMTSPLGIMTDPSEINWGNRSMLDNDSVRVTVASVAGATLGGAMLTTMTGRMIGAAMMIVVGWVALGKVPLAAWMVKL